MKNIEKIMAFLPLALFISCNDKVNDFDLENQQTQMSVFATIKSQTRMDGEKFEVDDVLGLYVTTSDDGMDGGRYVDNQYLIYDGKSYNAANTLYYPDSKSKCNFFIYYPYASAGAQAGTTLIPVQTYADQSYDSNFFRSDFMFGSESAYPTSDTINVEMIHKTCEFDVSIITDSKEIYDAALTSSSFIVKSLYTTANYDVENDCFTNLGTPKDVTMNGSWTGLGETDDGGYKLTGMRFIAIPQNMDNLSLTLNVGEQKLSCSLPKSGTVVGGTKYVMAINHSTGSGDASNVTATIRPWNVVEVKEKGTATETPSYFNVSSFDFTKSSVYRLYNSSGKLLGQVCREYLSGDGIDAAAIVYYKNCSLRSGTLLQVVGDESALCGGSVSWGDKSVLNYTEGSASRTITLFVDTNGDIAKGYDTSDCTPGTSKAYMIEDVRDGSAVNYAIVKIGSQYWMREELRATRYTDGKSIDCNNENLTTADAGYYTKNGNYFYNTAAVETLKLAPTGWRLPTTADIEVLTTYVNNEAYKLKATSGWSEAADNITPGSDITGFGAKGLGTFAKTGTATEITYRYQNTHFFMWLMDNTGMSIASEGFALVYTYNEIKTVKQTYALQAYSLRCIRD